MSIRYNAETKVCNIEDIHYRNRLISISNNKVLGQVTLGTQVKILSHDSIDESNIWNTDIELVVFRLIETGQFGYFHLIPAGYSEYTYDPDETLNVYDTNDFDYFIRYALDSEMRGYPKIADLIALHEVDKMLLGETKQEGENNG